MRLVARIMSQQLDRSKPLWEMWIIEGLDDGGFALISKTHHALIDGISGVDLATVMFDLTPVPPEVPHSDEPWQPQHEPTGAELVAGGAIGLARAAAGAAASALGIVRNPQATLRALGEAAEGLGEVAWAGLNPAPATPLNVEIGPHRRYRVVRNRLEDFKEVKNAFGGTVNDVVLTVVSGALRDWLHSRGVRTEGLELRALVPVSTRAKDEQGDLGNRITVMRGPLPVYIGDPIARLRAVKASMDGLKESKQAVGAEVLTGVQSFAPPTILAQASRLNFSTRLFNLIVTNVPGPQLPLVRAGPRDARRLPRRVPAQGPLAGDRDHVLQRADELRAARRLRRAARPRSHRRRHRGVAGRAAGAGAPAPGTARRRPAATARRGSARRSSAGRRGRSRRPWPAAARGCRRCRRRS